MKSILVAAEDESGRKLVSACLRRNNYSLNYSDNPMQVLDRLQEQSADLLILDAPSGSRLHLPKADVGCKILLISADPNQAEAPHGHAFLRRPFTPSALRNQVTALLGE